MRCKREEMNFPLNVHKLLMQFIPEYRHGFYNNANVSLSDDVTSLNEVLCHCRVRQSEDK
jgi:hypothetical protein